MCTVTCKIVWRVCVPLPEKLCEGYVFNYLKSCVKGTCSITWKAVWRVCVLLPEPLGLLGQRARVTSVGRLVQLRQQCLASLLARVVGKLDCDWLCGTRRLLPIQPLNGLLSFDSPVEADESHPSGDTCVWKKCAFSWPSEKRKKPFELF